MSQQVSATVVEVRDPSATDEINDGSFARTSDQTAAALDTYDSDHQIPRRTVSSLGAAAQQVLEIATATDGPDIVGVVTTGDTRNVDKAGVEAMLERLDNETMVVFVVHTNQAGDVDREFFDSLDNDHAKKKQIDVIYSDEENIGEVIGREVDEFLTTVAA